MFEAMMSQVRKVKLQCEAKWNLLVNSSVNLGSGQSETKMRMGPQASDLAPHSVF